MAFNTHNQSTISVGIANGQAISDTVNYSMYDKGTITTPATLTGTTLTYQVGDSVTGFFALKNAAGAVVTTPSTGTLTANTAYPLPDELRGANKFKVVSSANEAAARTLRISRKG